MTKGERYGLAAVVLTVAVFAGEIVRENCQPLQELWAGCHLTFCPMVIRKLEPGDFY